MLCQYFRLNDKRDARDAIDYLDGANLYRRPLHVAMAKYHRPDNPRAASRRKYGKKVKTAVFGKKTYLQEAIV